ncbi:hypothetical protein ABBQ32_008122 [Trebouxia sp. C0010 RCD-2024]
MEGKLEKNICFYKGCRKPGHRWDHCPKLAMHVAKNPAVRGFWQSQSVPAAMSSAAPLSQQSVAARQSSGYSKLAAASAAKPNAPDWVWSENRKLLPTVFQEIQALCNACGFTVHGSGQTASWHL